MSSADDSVQRIRLSELATGEPLPGHLRDSSGRVLVRAGQILTAELCETLSERTDGQVFVGSDWPQDPAPCESDDICPEELLEVLRQRRSKRSAQRLRQHDRRTWCVPLTLELLESHEKGVRRRQVEVTTHDISVGGFAFVFNQFIHPGTVVRARFDALPSRPCLTAIVRSCLLLSGTQHRVGTQFAKPKEGRPSPAERAE